MDSAERPELGTRAKFNGILGAYRTLMSFAQQTSHPVLLVFRDRAMSQVRNVAAGFAGVPRLDVNWFSSVYPLGAGHG